MQKLRIGLVGAGGGISGLRGKAVKAHPDAGVAMCYEPEEARQNKLRERYPDVPVARSAEELFASRDVDAVIVSTPNTAHFALAEKALLAGKHVCVEYPMVQTLAEYDRLTALAREKGVVLHDGLTPPLENYHLAVKECVPKIGKALSAYVCYYLGKIGWYWREEFAGDFFVILTIHQLQHLRDLFGPVSSVYARMNDTPAEGGNVRSAQACFSFANGVPAVIENGWGLPKAPGLVYRVIGSGGLVEFVEENGRYFRRLAVAGADAQTTEIPLDFAKTLGDDTRIFISEVLEGAQPKVSLGDGREALRLCLLASRSASEGRSIEA